MRETCGKTRRMISNAASDTTLKCTTATLQTSVLSVSGCIGTAFALLLPEVKTWKLVLTASGEVYDQSTPVAVNKYFFYSVHTDKVINLLLLNLKILKS